MNIPFYEIKQNDIVVKKPERELLFPAHLHEEVEIAYVLRGSQRIAIGDKLYKVNEGNAVIILPEEIHEYMRDKSVKKQNKNADTLIIICNTKIFNGIFPDFYKYKVHMPLISSEELSLEAKEAFNNIYHNKNEYAAVYGWICVALHYMLKNIDIVKIDGIKSERTVSNILNYISDNFTENINLDDLADSLHLSKYYVSHIFSEKLGVNFRTYIGMLRAEYAAKLIRTTNNTMTEISNIAGFDTQRTFNRVFGKIYGMTPTEYKNNVKNYWR